MQLALQSAGPVGDDDGWQKTWAALGSELVAAMQQRPVPDTLHRVTTSAVKIDDDEIPAGATVVIGVGSASRELAERGGLQPGNYEQALELVFGGVYGNADQPAHACPGMRMAMGTLAGIFCALLERRGWQEHDAPLVLNKLER